MLDLPLVDFQHLIAVLTGREEFSAGKTLRAAHNIIGYLLDKVFPEGAEIKALGTGDEADQNLVIALEALALDAQTEAPAEGEVSAQFFDSLPIPKEMILKMVLSMLTKWIEKQVAAM